MKRWAWLTVVLYGALFLTLTVPFFLAVGFDWFSPSNDSSRVWSHRFAISWDDAVDVYGYWTYWLWLAVMLAAQFILLLIPMDLVRDRPRPTRSLIVPVITTGLLLGLITLGGLLSLLAAFYADEGLNDLWNSLQSSPLNPQTIPWVATWLRRVSWDPSEEVELIAFMAGTGLVFWMIWALVFFNVTRNDTSESFLKRTTRWLLRGSILELLVAVPCHVVVRHRNDCCAVWGTFWGLVMGLCVMVLAFGPGIFFLFMARARRLQPRGPGSQPE